MAEEELAIWVNALTRRDSNLSCVRNSSRTKVEHCLWPWINRGQGTARHQITDYKGEIIPTEDSVWPNKWSIHKTTSQSWARMGQQQSSMLWSEAGTRKAVSEHSWRCKCSLWTTDRLDRKTARIRTRHPVSRQVLPGQNTHSPKVQAWNLSFKSNHSPKDFREGHSSVVCVLCVYRS